MGHQYVKLDSLDLRTALGGEGGWKVGCLTSGVFQGCLRHTLNTQISDGSFRECVNPYWTHLDSTEFIQAFVGGPVHCLHSNTGMRAGRIGPEVLSELRVCTRMALLSRMRAMTTRLFWKGWRSLLSSAILQWRVPGQRQKEKEQAQPDSLKRRFWWEKGFVHFVLKSHWIK